MSRYMSWTGKIKWSSILFVLGSVLLIAFNNCSKMEVSSESHSEMASQMIRQSKSDVEHLASGSEERWVPNRIIVQPRVGLSESELKGVLRSVGGQVVDRIDGIDARVVELPPQASEKAVAALLSKNPRLEFAELDRLVSVNALVNDPYYGSAWHLPKIGAHIGWDITMGNGVTIAILDTGVDSAHPDLSARIVPGWDFVLNSADTSDLHGHGTKVAGTAAATTNNGVGVASLAGDSSLMPIRIADATGYASYSNIAKGLTWSADKGARVANISISGVAGSSTVLSAAQYMRSKGGVVVAGAGNSGAEEGIGATDAIISVSGTTSSDVKASWSSYGNYVDLAAPGASIYTTTRGGGYGSASGTSFAGPVVAGAVALMMAANPSLSPSQLEKLLLSTTVDLGAAGWDKYFGHGRVDVAAAVAAARDNANAVDRTVPSVQITSPTGGSTLSGLVVVAVSASDNVGVARVDLYIDNQKIASDSTVPFGFNVDTTLFADGSAVLQAQAFDAAGNSAVHSISVNIDNTPTPTPAPTPTPTPTPTLAFSSISPSQAKAGQSVDATISGSGFKAGASVVLSGGSGPAPVAEVLSVAIDGASLRVRITTKTGGPSNLKQRYWDIRVGNSDGTSVSKAKAFLVLP